MSQCEYFSLWNAETESLSEWGKKLYEANENDLPNEYDDSLFEREDIESPSSLGKDKKDRLIRRKLELAEEKRIEENLPKKCPHNRVDEEPHCIFHLSVNRYEEHEEITADLVCSKLLNKMHNEDETDRDCENPKCFAGGRFSELSLTYRTLASRSNRPIQMQFAEIESLNLNETVIDERIIFDACEIQSFSCESARFRREVRFENSVFDCETIHVTGSSFSERVSFREASLLASNIKIKKCNFEGDFIFENVDIKLEHSDNNDITTTFGVTQTTFESKFNCAGGRFFVGEEINADINIKFNNCNFEDRADLSEVKIDPANELDRESDSMELDPGWGENESIASDEQTKKMRLFFQNTEFNSGAKLIESQIEGELNLDSAKFSAGDVNFTGTKIDGDMILENATFGDGDLSFKGTKITGNANFESVMFGKGDLIFNDAEIECVANLKQTEFTGKEANFSDIDIGESFNMEGAVFEVSGGYIRFNKFCVKGEANFELATFSGKKIDFRDMTINGNFSLEHAEFDTVTNDFRGLKVLDAETFDMSHAVFLSNETRFDDMEIACDEVTFKEATFNSDVNFSGIEVTGGELFDMSHATFSAHYTNFNGMQLGCDEVTFRHARFEGDIDFSETDSEEGRTDTSIIANRFDMSLVEVRGDLNFNKVNLECDDIDFSRISGQNGRFEFEGVRSGDTNIVFEDATIIDGTFSIAGYETVYDFNGATVGDINIKNEEGEKLFEHFIFRDTDFDGFDFSKNDLKQKLKQSGWNIHTSNWNKNNQTHGGLLWSGLRFLKRGYRLIREGPDKDAVHPDDLESTYMKAKIGAEKQGDPDTISQFFRKELHFRRQTYGYLFWEQVASESNERNKESEIDKSRVELAYDWMANITLAATVGYGERPGNVVLTSLGLIFFFSFAYRAVDALPPGSSQLEYLTYSFQGFIQLIIGVQPAGNVLVRLFTSIEGFIGAFIIALFVITLTRSIDR